MSPPSRTTALLEYSCTVNRWGSVKVTETAKRERWEELLTIELWFRAAQCRIHTHMVAMRLLLRVSPLGEFPCHIVIGGRSVLRQSCGIACLYPHPPSMTKGQSRVLLGSCPASGSAFTCPLIDMPTLCSLAVPLWVSSFFCATTVSNRMWRRESKRRKELREAQEAIEHQKKQAEEAEMKRKQRAQEAAE